MSTQTPDDPSFDHDDKQGRDDNSTTQVGNIANSKAIAIGRNAQALNIEIYPQLLTGIQSSTVPPKPDIFIGRDAALNDILTRLEIPSTSSTGNIQVLTAIRGWPGVGKSTLVNALAHHERIATLYPDGVLWVSLGQKPHILSHLIAWGRVLAQHDILMARSIEEASSRLRALLQNQKRLIIVDDVWASEDVEPFKVGGRNSALLVTTREFGIANAVAGIPENIYKLDVLSPAYAFELLSILAPEAVRQYPTDCEVLIQELEGLPLAIQVAGRLLAEETFIGFDVPQLIADLREGTALVMATAPPDRVSWEQGVTPSVTALLHKSTDLLDPTTRYCFACLGVFAPKPAIFDTTAIMAVWDVADPQPTVRHLVKRGLLEPQGDFFQMHSLLAMHARSLLQEERTI